jgi:hypothetical protein
MNFLIKRTISEFPIAMDWPGSYSSVCFLPFKSFSVSIIAIDAVMKKLNLIWVQMEIGPYVRKDEDDDEDV